MWWFTHHFSNTENNFHYTSVWWLELRRVLLLWCGLGELWCRCISAGQGRGEWVRAVGPEEMSFCTSVFGKKICWLQVLCLNLLLPALPDLGVGNGCISASPVAQASHRAGGRRSPKCGWGLGWAALRREGECSAACCSFSRAGVAPCGSVPPPLHLHPKRSTRGSGWLWGRAVEMLHGIFYRPAAGGGRSQSLSSSCRSCWWRALCNSWAWPCR